MRGIGPGGLNKKDQTGSRKEGKEGAGGKEGSELRENAKEMTACEGKGNPPRLQKMKGPETLLRAPLGARSRRGGFTGRSPCWQNSPIIFSSTE